MTWHAIVSTNTATGRPEKYQAFNSEIEANGHIVNYGGSVHDLDDIATNYTIRGGAVNHEPVVPVPLTAEERYERLEESGVFSAMKRAVFELIDRVIALEGGTPISDEQKKQWLTDKAIGQ